MTLQMDRGLGRRGVEERKKKNKKKKKKKGKKPILSDIYHIHSIQESPVKVEEITKDKYGHVNRQPTDGR